eukprot:4560023-Amphidinium_carterae.1
MNSSELYSEYLGDNIVSSVTVPRHVWAIDATLHTQMEQLCTADRALRSKMPSRQTSKFWR